MTGRAPGPRRERASSPPNFGRETEPEPRSFSTSPASTCRRSETSSPKRWQEKIRAPLVECPDSAMHGSPNVPLY
jgi:hypothetical protein